MSIAQLEYHRVPLLEQSLNDGYAMSQNTSCHQIGFGDFHCDAAHGCCSNRKSLESRAGLQSRGHWSHPGWQRADCFPNMFDHLVIGWSGNRRAPWKRPLRLLKCINGESWIQKIVKEKISLVSETLTLEKAQCQSGGTIEDQEAPLLQFHHPLRSIEC